jgi:hypothetical protein
MMKSMRQSTRNEIKANAPRLQSNENHGGDNYGKDMLIMMTTKIRMSITTKKKHRDAPDETTNETKTKIKRNSSA